MSINVYHIEDDRTFIIYWLIIYLEFPTYLNTFYVFSNFIPKYYVEDAIFWFHRRGNWGIKISNRPLPTQSFGASFTAQLVKNMPTMQETLVQFLGWEDPLEKEMATHSRILA